MKLYALEFQPRVKELGSERAQVQGHHEWIMAEAQHLGQK